nr:hypothetical protein BgiMline_016355 [Biomphalaria glabrata]
MWPTNASLALVLLLVICLWGSACQAVQNAPCRDETDCDPEECCTASLSSGKDGIFSVCKKILTVGDVCSPAGTARVNQCGCGHGTSCVLLGETHQCLYLPG